MSPLNVPLPELDQFPLERRKAIVEGFNTSAETAAIRERLGKLPFRLAAVLTLPVIGVMVWGYDMGVWPCMLAGFLCFVIGIPIGILCQSFC
jgi:ABC-type proline/glycine betaine transport system permease subunit